MISFIRKANISGLVIIYLVLCYLKDYLNELIPENIYGYPFANTRAKNKSSVMDRNEVAVGAHR